MQEFTLEDWKDTPVSLYMISDEAQAALQKAIYDLEAVCVKHDIQMVVLTTTGQTQSEYRTFGASYISDPSKVSTEVIFGDMMLTNGFAVAYSLIDLVATAVQDRYTTPYLKEVKK